MNLALRLARRDIAQHRARSAMICLLVMIPLALLSWVAVLNRSTMATDGQARTALLGQATALITAERLEQKLPETSLDGAVPLQEGQRVLPVTLRQAELTTPNSTQEIDVVAADWRDPGLEGSLLGPLEKDGRGVWASEGLRYVLGFTEGDRISVDGVQYVFNGYLASGGMQGLMVLPGHPLAGTVVAEQYLFGPSPLPDQVAAWGKVGASVDTGEGLGNEDFTITGALALTASMVASILAATVAAAAFTIGAAQQRRNRALVQLTGAPDRVLRQIVTAQGLLLGGIGAATGLVLGTVAGVVQVLIDLDKVPRTFYALAIPWLLILAMGAFSLAATVLAAWLPARRLVRASAVEAVRTDVQLPEQARPSIPGLVAIVLGLVIAVAGGLLARGRMEDWTGGGGTQVENFVIPGLLGALLLFFGLLAQTGWLLSKLPAAGASMPVRLAVRDGQRHRSRWVSAVAATLAVATLAVTSMTAFRSLGEEEWHSSQPIAPGWARLSGKTVDGSMPKISDAQLAKIRGVLDETVGPVRGMARGRELGITLPQCAEKACSGRQIGASLERDQLAALLGKEATPTVLAAFDRGAVVVDGDTPLKGGRFPLWLPLGSPSAKEVLVEAVQVPSTGGAVLVPPSLATAHRLETAAPAILVRLQDAPTWQQAGDFSDAIQKAGLPPVGLEAEPPASDGYSSANGYVLPIALVVLLGIATLTSGLAQRDAMAEQRTLAGLGAERRTIRTVAAIQAAITSALGIGLALLVGTLPLAASFAMSHGRMPFVLPWLHLAGLLVSPLLAAAAAWLVVRPPAPHTGRRA